MEGGSTYTATSSGGGMGARIVRLSQSLIIADAEAAVSHCRGHQQTRVALHCLREKLQGLFAHAHATVGVAHSRADPRQALAL